MSRSALIVIDMQRGLVAAAWESDRLLEVHARLLEWAREQGIPVLAMQHDGQPGSLVPVGSEAWELQPGLLSAQVPVIRKTASDSFYGTDLAARLSELGVSELILTGIKSERCVDTTARAAVSRGFQVLLVADAHSTMNSPVLEAERIVSFTNHNLNGFGNQQATIRLIDSAALLERGGQA